MRIDRTSASIIRRKSGEIQQIPFRDMTIKFRPKFEVFVDGEDIADLLSSYETESLVEWIVDNAHMQRLLGQEAHENAKAHRATENFVETLRAALEDILPLGVKVPSRVYSDEMMKRGIDVVGLEYRFHIANVCTDFASRGMMPEMWFKGREMGWVMRKVDAP